MAPQIPDGECPHCRAPIIDLFAEWTDEYASSAGKRAILAGDVVFDCYYCQGPIQLVLPLALAMPQKSGCRVGKRKKSKCEDWLRNQHPGKSLSEIVDMAGWQHAGKWAFDGYNWQEGAVHHHGRGLPPP